MYNFALAFVICGVVYFIGEAVSNLTKAWIPSVFVTAAVLLVGFWTVIPTTVVSDSMLIPFGSTIGIYLLITHMGTVISIKQLVSQWKTIVVCLAGLAGMCALCLVVLPGIIGRDLVVAGLPPLTGGIIAATTMMKAAEANGLAEAAIFAIAMYCRALPVIPSPLSASSWRARSCSRATAPVSTSWKAPSAMWTPSTASSTTALLRSTRS